MDSTDPARWGEETLELLESLFREQGVEAGTLYIVGTPIGNIADMSIRALAVLQQVDYVLAEDTRTSGLMLQHFAIKPKYLSYHKFNEQQRLQEVKELLLEGKSLALISDAGMPGISDPGQGVIDMALTEGLPLKLVPGPTAFASAAAISGMEIDDLRFLGFLPLKGKRRENILEGMKSSTSHFVFYEAPHRVEKTLEDFRLLGYGQRQLFVARELTKTYEELLRGTVNALLEHFQTYKPRGEFVLILGPSSEEELSMGVQRDYQAIEERIKDMLAEEASAKDILQVLGPVTNLPKNTLKSLIQRLKNEIS